MIILSIRQEKFNNRRMHIRSLDGQFQREQVCAAAGILAVPGEVGGLDFRAVVEQLSVLHAVAQAGQMEVFERPGEDVQVKAVRLRDCTCSGSPAVA